ncbi:uncharacterized protein LOC6032990 [Culex quinquefasciatus]|uniref:uncharacterized protein LOC6032990 n=1 Tax=Culex quinquefasciatus TaxID=7176 RepID=UPI0018E37D0A|nr:uncharacterized protein LOC6032990 [Culex quinquefasciatus]
MERFVPAGDSYYDPACPDESDDEEQPLGGWNPAGSDPSKEELVIRDSGPTPTYTEADLYPTIPDPECLPEWPLACYWPVYVSNFRLDNFAEEARNEQIANFFAAKGLLVRMIFMREPEGCLYFKKFQRSSLLLDMLVYFTSKEDAQWAVRTCHRQTYYGHRLNVWPGRTPEYFDNTRSIRFQLPKTKCAAMSESVVELILRNKGHAIDTVARMSIVDVIVEFGNEESMRNAVRGTEYWIPFELQEPTMKQRFLERDVRIDLMQVMREKLTFMAMTPPQEVLEALLAGIPPSVDRSWENMNKPRPPPEAVVKLIKAKRTERKQFMEEKRGQGKKRPVETTGNVLLEGEPAPKAMTLKQLKGVVRNQANRILNKNKWTRANTMDCRLAKLKDKYLDARNDLLNLLALKKFSDPQRRQQEELFYQMLAIEYQMMEMIPQSSGALYCPPLELGLAKACLVAGELLPFPEPPTFAVDPEKYVDEVPPANPSLNQPPPFIPTVRPYCAADLNPTTVDPSCDPDWPLAHLWPVYVFNFRVNVLRGDRRNDQIREYFAAKGLLATCIFIPYDCEAISNQLIDMLVYFTSREDAATAIELCHRDSYYGHRLNVFPGREPVFFDVTGGRTIVVPIKQERPIPLDSLMRNAMRPDRVTSCNRFEDGVAFYEYGDPNDAEHAILAIRKQRPNKAFRPYQLKELRKKQRFLESDKKADILEQVARDGQPQPALLEALIAGSVPAGLLNWNWRGWTELRSWPGQKCTLEKQQIRNRLLKVLDIWRQMVKIPLD